MIFLDEILVFVKDFTGDDSIHAATDIFDSGLYGDDLDNLLMKYSDHFEVDMDSYLWYFHNEEEGAKWATMLFKSPDMRVDRIPITPKLLAEFAATKTWNVAYPEHSIPKRRYDIILTQLVSIFLILFAIFLLAIQNRYILN